MKKTTHHSSSLLSDSSYNKSREQSPKLRSSLHSSRTAAHPVPVKAATLNRNGKLSYDDQERGRGGSDHGRRSASVDARISTLSRHDYRKPPPAPQKPARTFEKRRSVSRWAIDSLGFMAEAGAAQLNVCPFTEENVTVYKTVRGPKVIPVKSVEEALYSCTPPRVSWTNYYSSVLLQKSANFNQLFRCLNGHLQWATFHSHNGLAHVHGLRLGTRWAPSPRKTSQWHAPCPDPIPCSRRGHRGIYVTDTRSTTHSRLTITIITVWRWASTTPNLVIHDLQMIDTHPLHRITLPNHN